MRLQLIAASLPLICAAPLAAFQPLRVEGRVVGPDGQPVAGQAVVLHRVTPEGGTLLAQATAGDDGRFALEAPGPVPADAVFFVASRYEGRLYIGPMLRPPLEAGSEVTLEVGDPTRALELAAAPATAPPQALPGAATGTSRRWLLLLAPVAGLLGVVGWAISAAVGPGRRRRLLIRIAQLDNRFQDAGEAGVAAEYQARRRRLLDELDAIG